MSLDSLTGGVAPPNIAAIIAGELAALATDAQTLGARLAPGDIVAAVVLPSNGLTDLLEVGGLRVAAELPPTLVPGQAISVMVTGVGDGRINLRIVADPEGVASDPAARVAASKTALLAQAQKPERTPPGRSAPTPDVAGEPHGVNTLARPAARTPAPAIPLRAPVASPTTTAARPATAQPASAQPAPALKNIEARLAAAHAMTSPTARPAVTSTPSATEAKPAATTVATTASRLLPRTGSGAARPPIGVRLPSSLPSSPQAAPALVRSAARGTQAFGEPASLLRALRLPVTATNVASARMALESPEKLPAALATLERALVNRSDPRLATLNTLATFVGRLDPRSPVLGAQIAAFVDHVVIGGEAKFAQLARAAVDAAPAAGHAAGAAANAPPFALERIAVARAALDYDLKTQLLSVAADAANSVEGAAPKTAALHAAVAGALTAITALQLNAATALSANPDGFAFSMPVSLPDGFAAARVRIDRDAPDGRKTPLDGDNFHIAFVLETRHLGTVAIDLMTVGRAVTVSVKTEAAPAQRAFGSALTDLTTRLEKLRYRVTKADAVVAPLPDQERERTVVRPAADPNRLVDTDA